MCAATILEGGCLCGRTRYTVTGPVRSVGLCHCRSCRLASGATPVRWAVVAAEGFRWIGTPPAAHESSPGVIRTRCATCGTPLAYRVAGEATLDVTIATLEDPAALVPEREIWLSHRVPWAAVDPARPGFSRGRGD